jgi:superkiller protein 3
MEDPAEQHFNEGLEFVKLGRYSDALASCDKAIAINPNHLETWINRGNLLGILGRHSEAVASCSKALVINPNDNMAKQLREIALKNKSKPFSS